jgi:hypothetical protein
VGTVSGPVKTAGFAGAMGKGSTDARGRRNSGVTLALGINFL